MLYTLVVTNSGSGAVDNNTIVMTDQIPANTSICVSNACSNPPVSFSCSVAPACGLTYTYASNVTYSNVAGGCSPPLTPYTPVPDGAGYDTNVKCIRINPGGLFSGAASAPYPSFTLRFKLRVN